jgi:hypothetical protein
LQSFTGINYSKYAKKLINRSEKKRVISADS